MIQKFRSEEFEIGEIVRPDGAFVVDNTRSGYLTIETPDGEHHTFISGGDIWVHMDRAEYLKGLVEEAEKAHDEGRTLIFPEDVTLEEAKRLHADFQANGGGNVQVSGIPEDVMRWILFGSEPTE